MIIFLYGEDSYSSQQKLNEILKKYKAKHKTGLNFRWVDFIERDLKELKELMETSPMFKEKKLLILENVFERNTDWQKELVGYFKKSEVERDENIALVFFEKQVPDRRTELFKFLTKKPNFSQDARNLEDIKLENWIKKEVEKQGGKIEAGAVKKLAASVGSDLWQMANEISKLISFCGQGGVIKEKDIELLVKAKVDLNIFNTVDALAKKDKKQVFKLLHQHLEQGENKIYLMTMFVRQFRNLLEIKDLLERGTGYYELPKKTGLHPFVVRKTCEQAKNFSLAGLKKIYAKLLDLDLSTKTGRIDAQTALDNLVMGI